MKENERFTNLIEELRSLPEPNFEKDFDINKQYKIHDNLMNFSKRFEKNKRKGTMIKHLSTPFLAIAALLLFSIIFFSNNDDSSNLSSPVNQEGSQNPEFELYKGNALKIAVIGQAPTVKETQVTFEEISFSDLTQKQISSFDAVIITEENLQQASKSKYANIYVNSTIPFFFLSAYSHIPFTMEGNEFNKYWKWAPGKEYAVGILKSQEDESLKGWGFGLYNDEMTEKNLQNVYSRIFEVINEIDSSQRNFNY